MNLIVLSFRRALTKMSKILRHKIKNHQLPDFPSNDASLRNIGIDTQIVHCIAKETCHSPKRNTLHRLENDPTLNDEIVKRFKNCPGKVVCRVSHVDENIILMLKITIM